MTYEDVTPLLHVSVTQQMGVFQQPDRQGDTSMTIETDFSFPKEEYRSLLKAFYTEINGPESFEPPLEWQGENWSSRVVRSRGAGS